MLFVLSPLFIIIANYLFNFNDRVFAVLLTADIVSIFMAGFMVAKIWADNSTKNKKFKRYFAVFINKESWLAFETWLYTASVAPMAMALIVCFNKGFNLINMSAASAIGVASLWVVLSQKKPLFYTYLFCIHINKMIHFVYRNIFIFVKPDKIYRTFKGNNFLMFDNSGVVSEMNIKDKDNHKMFIFSCKRSKVQYYNKLKNNFNLNVSLLNRINNRYDDRFNKYNISNKLQ